MPTPAGPGPPAAVTVEARFDVLGVGITATDPERAAGRIAGWIAAGERHYVCLANVHGVMEAQRDPELRRAYEGASLTAPDGMPLVWLGRLGGHPSVRRVYGPDLTLLLCELAAVRGWSCFFYGGAPGVAASLAEALRRRFPGLRSAGACSPPFRPLQAAEEAELLEGINAADPDIVWVGLGCPKQERWMAAHRSALRARVLIGVGAAFDFHTGGVKQAPRWMQSSGLEWLFRLMIEPRRLWRRYLLYNPLFVLYVVRDGLRRAWGSRLLQ